MTNKDVIQLPFCKRGDVEQEIRRLANDDTARVALLSHAKDRMLQRGITSRQIFNTLRCGTLSSSIEWDTKKDRGWKCKFCHITAGIKVTVIAKLIERSGSRCLIVTVW